MGKEPGQLATAPPSISKPDKRFSELVLKTMSEVNPHHDPMQELVALNVASEIEKVGKEKPGLMEVLEIGTGDGVSARQILEASHSAKIIGTDNDADLTAKARGKLVEYIKNGRLEIRDDDTLEFLKSFPDNSVEIITSVFTIHNFKKDYREEVLREMFRVLRHGGVFVTGDKIIPDDEEFFKKEFTEQMVRFEAFQDKAQSVNWIKHYREDIQEDMIMRERDLVGLLKEIGFKEIIVTERRGLQALLRTKK